MTIPQKQSLEERVIRFLEKRAGVENIDKLHLTPAQLNAEKADFFLSQRQVICEVKSLQTDVEEKVHIIMKPIMESDYAPIFYGSWNLDKVLKDIPNAEAIKREIFDAVTASIQNLFRKANRQIRVTK